MLTPTKVHCVTQDVEYLNHTSLKTYFPYMMGGGYVLSADLAAVILGINQQSHGHDLLKFMPNEDVSVGFWLMSVDLRRIDHQRVVSSPHHRLMCTVAQRSLFVTPVPMPPSSTRCRLRCR
jgi:hypothetical protein